MRPGSYVQSTAKEIVKDYTINGRLNDDNNRFIYLKRVKVASNQSLLQAGISCEKRTFTNSFCFDYTLVSDFLNNKASDGSVIPVRFTRLYMTMLIILAILLTIGQGLTQWRLRAVQDEIWVTRYAALQRHQSQQIVKQALQLADPNEQTNFSANIADLRQVFPVFERYHLLGRQGRAENPKIAVTNSATVQKLYEAIRPEFDAFRQSARRLMRLQSFDEIRRPEVQASVKLLLANEKPFLEEIDGIVREYNSEVRSKLTLLQSLAFYLYLSTIMTMVAIGLLIFRPATRKLKQTFAQLVEAESQTTAANKKLLSANKSLKETRQKLFEATKLQYQQQMDDQKLRTSYLIAGQEEERKRLSRELHDGLGQMLTAIKLQIEGLEAGLMKAVASEQNGPIAYPKNLKTLKSLVTQTIQETRTISNNLMPTVLSDFGAVPALKMLAEHNRNETVDVTFETNLTTDMPRLDKNVEITLYRVTQEAVSNAVKHANATHIHIDLKERGNVLQLEISDDGQGFVVPRKKQANGLMKPREEAKSGQSEPIKLRPPSQGLHNIQERTKLLNGKFKINSMVGKGTRILVTIPYQTHFAHHGTY